MTTIDTATTITTAARRIARDANSTPHAVTRYYTESGDVIAAHETGMEYLSLSDAPTGWAVRLAGRRGAERMTYREAQDMLDAAASGDRILYLADLETARYMAGAR